MVSSTHTRERERKDPVRGKKKKKKVYNENLAHSGSDTHWLKWRR